MDGRIIEDLCTSVIECSKMYLLELYQSLSDREVKEMYKECDGLAMKKMKNPQVERWYNHPLVLALELLSHLTSAMPFTSDVIHPLSL